MKYLPQFSHKKIYDKIALCMKGTLLSNLFITLSILSPLFPNTANAGFFSFISDFSGQPVSAKSLDTTSSINSQNMILLEAAVNTDPNPHKSDEVPILAYGNALSAEIGPQGTISDIESRIPNEISLYTVRDGDNLSKIASMFDVSVNTIIWANDLGSNPSLKEGRILVILPVSGIKYTIKEKDTPKLIAIRYKVKMDELLSYNNLTTSSVLIPGTTIIIPDAQPIFTKVSAKPGKKTGHVNPAHDTDGPYYPGYFDRPVDDGRLTQGLHGHNAIDLAAPIGTAIHASAAGKVISVMSNGAWNGGYGNYIVIAHNNGTHTLYAHTLKNYVRVGDSVTQGELIAKLGLTGDTTGAHVHFEIWDAMMPPSFLNP